MKIDCLIIEDEPSSQNVLKKYISDINSLNLILICNNAMEALEILNSNQNIDLIFLDINMPKISGLSFYKSLQTPPEVIFTTAYPQYAVEGFEVNAIDYLLKPFSFERFLTSINKATRIINSSQEIISEKSFIFIKADKKTHKIKIDQILFIEAFGDYVKIHLENSFLLTYNRFSNFLDQLPQNKFIQTHKSFAIAIDKVQSIESNQITIQKHLIPIGQKYRNSFLKELRK